MIIKLRTSNDRLDVKYIFDKDNKSVYYQFGMNGIWGKLKKVVYNTNADTSSLTEAISIYCKKEGIEEVNRWEKGYWFGKRLTDMLFG